jgi:hypothetical protein
LAQRFSSFVAAKPVQVELALHGPFAFAQFARHVGPDAGASEAELIVHIEQGAHIKLVAHAFAQSCLIV